MKNVAIVFMFIIIVTCAYLFTVTRLNRQVNNRGLGVIPSSQRLDQQYCQDKKGNRLSYMQALEIAQKSDCNKQSNVLITFTEDYQCNETTSTFWVDLNMNPEKSGCNPACVVNLSDKTAEINWRCTGAMPSK